jgi:RimJ/RimL family protein N-acetyltransferase
MDKSDLQIGDVWTSSEHRGRGLATYALRKVVEENILPGRKFWYVAEEGNLGSIKVAEKAGFTKCGVGFRTKRLGLSLLGSYKMLTE